MTPHTSAALFTLALLVLAGPARADLIADPPGDFLNTYTGPHDPGLDVLSHQATLAGDRLVFYGEMDGPIAPTQLIGGIYIIGVDRGRGTPRFLAGTPVIGPNVLWDLIVRINPNGTGLVNNQIAGVATPLNPADIVIDGNVFTASVPLSLLTPAATLPPCEWTYNLWPRNGLVPGQNQNVSDLAPDDGNSPVQTVPEVECITDRTVLWPPNHKMVEVRVFIAANDLCTARADLVLLDVSFTSDEPDNAPGDDDGHTTGDTDGGDGFIAPANVTTYFTFNAETGGFEGSVFLRAERSEVGGGRRYTIEATVVNNDNNLGTSQCHVVVPVDLTP
jgi:hypothetical protein